MLTGTSLVSWARLFAVTTISARAESSSAAVVAANAMGPARLRAASKPPTHHGPWPDARRSGIGAAISRNCNESFSVPEDERIVTYSPRSRLVNGRCYRYAPPMDPAAQLRIVPAALARPAGFPDPGVRRRGAHTSNLADNGPCCPLL